MHCQLMSSYIMGNGKPDHHRTCSRPMGLSCTQDRHTSRRHHHIWDRHNTENHHLTASPHHTANRMHTAGQRGTASQGHSLTAGLRSTLDHRRMERPLPSECIAGRRRSRRRTHMGHRLMERCRRTTGQDPHPTARPRFTACRRPMGPLHRMERHRATGRHLNRVQQATGNHTPVRRQCVRRCPMMRPCPTEHRRITGQRCLGQGQCRTCGRRHCLT